MIGYILTNEQKDLVQGQYVNPYAFINCVQDINGIWFFFCTEQEQPEILATQYAWLLDCPQGEYIPKPSPPFPI